MPDTPEASDKATEVSETTDRVEATNADVIRGADELVKQQRKEMLEQKDTDRPPKYTSMKFGRLAIVDDDGSELVKGFNPGNVSSELGDGGNQPVKDTRPKFPTADDDDRKLQLEDQRLGDSDKDGRKTGEKNAENGDSPEPKPKLEELQHLKGAPHWKRSGDGSDIKYAITADGKERPVIVIDRGGEESHYKYDKDGNVTDVEVAAPGSAERHQYHYTGKDDIWIDTTMAGPFSRSREIWMKLSVDEQGNRTWTDMETKETTTRRTDASETTSKNGRVLHEVERPEKALHDLSFEDDWLPPESIPEPEPLNPSKPNIPVDSPLGRVRRDAKE